MKPPEKKYYVAWDQCFNILFPRHRQRGHVFLYLNDLNTLVLTKLLAIFILLLSSGSVFSQKLDRLFFNLYTDSLKKGTYNYINVDGQLSNGTYMPLTEKELRFTTSAGSFDRNSLFIDSSIVEKKVHIKVYLKSDSTVCREITIYIKQHESTEGLKTIDEVLPPNSRKRKRSS